MTKNRYKIAEAASIVDFSRATVYKYINEFHTIFKDYIHSSSGVKYIDDDGLEILRKIEEMKVHKNISLDDIEAELLKSKYGESHTGEDSKDSGVDKVQILMGEKELLKKQNETLNEEVQFLRSQQKELTKTINQQNIIIAHLTQQNTKLLEDRRSQSLWHRVKVAFGHGRG